MVAIDTTIMDSEEDTEADMAVVMEIPMEDMATTRSYNRFVADYQRIRSVLNLCIVPLYYKCT